MSQLVWMFSLLPDSIFVFLGYAILLSGLMLFVASKLTNWIPIMAQYRMPAELVGVILLCTGCYFLGWRGNEEKWQDRVKELEQKLLIAETRSQEVNTVVEEKVLEKTRVVKEKGRDIIKYVDRLVDREVIKEIPGPERVRREEIIKYVEQCPVPKEIIDLHNSATELNKAAEGKK
jgi:hypothetical protein